VPRANAERKVLSIARRVDMSFRIRGLSAAPFRHLYGLSDDALAAHGAKRYVVDAKPGFPDRIEVRDLELGETALLVNFTHQPADTPYRASHAIFVREWADRTYDGVDTIPDVLRVRVLSLRAFDAEHMMVDADVVDGRDVEQVIAKMIGNLRASYVHVHYAKPGCYAARIERA
jgi:hypothetical protein